jgi:hypothetical protein
MNLAEGKVRFSQKKFVRYRYIARGSLYETVTLSEIFKRKLCVCLRALVSAANGRETKNKLSQRRIEFSPFPEEREKKPKNPVNPVNPV